MSDTITQMRLSLRLDRYLNDYQEKIARNDTISRYEWDSVWKVADAARIRNSLTPEIVDNVRIVYDKL
jgi:hypothetical protein